MGCLLRILVALYLSAALCNCQKPHTCDETRVRNLLKNPPREWTIHSITQEDIDGFICSETLVTAVVDCFESFDKCAQVEGMAAFVDEIYSRIDEGNNCPTCDPELMDKLINAVRVVQKRFPKQYVRGLAFF